MAHALRAVRPLGALTSAKRFQCHFREVSVLRQPPVSKAKWKGNGKKTESRYTCTRTSWVKASIHKSQNWPPLMLVLPASQRQHEEGASKVTATTQVAKSCTLGLAELLCSQVIQPKVGDSAFGGVVFVMHQSARLCVTSVQTLQQRIADQRRESDNTHQQKLNLTCTLHVVIMRAPWMGVTDCGGKAAGSANLGLPGPP